MIQAPQSFFQCMNSNDSNNPKKSFKFYQCDTLQLLHQSIVLPYVPSSITFNDFIILSDYSSNNWKPETMHKPHFLLNTNVLQQISLCLFDWIKHLSQTIITTQNELTQTQSQILILQTKLQTQQKLYIVCCLFSCFFVLIYNIYLLYCIHIWEHN